MSYRVTYPYIEMDVVDTKAKNNISDIIATENVEVSDSNLLKQDNNIILSGRAIMQIYPNIDYHIFVSIFYLVL